MSTAGRRPILTVLSAILALSAPASADVPAAIDAGLAWRLVGPLRAGWGAAVTGIPEEPDVYFSGAAGGGMWKTTDAGDTWTPLFQDGPPAIGAIAVAPSDPRVIYVGTGQVTTRYDVGAGAGLFRSEDGGATWAKAGLEETRHIGQILIDPADHRRVLVAALGPLFGPSASRGVFRSEDGGRTWSRTLFVSETTGAVDLAADPQDPRVVFAALWQVRYRP